MSRLISFGACTHGCQQWKAAVVELNCFVCDSDDFLLKNYVCQRIVGGGMRTEDAVGGNKAIMEKAYAAGAALLK
jgi:hypothetical protein